MILKIARRRLRTHPHRALIHLWFYSIHSRAMNDRFRERYVRSAMADNGAHSCRQVLAERRSAYVFHAAPEAVVPLTTRTAATRVDHLGDGKALYARDRIGFALEQQAT